MIVVCRSLLTSVSSRVAKYVTTFVTPSAAATRLAARSTCVRNAESSTVSESERKTTATLFSAEMLNSSARVTEPTAESEPGTSMPPDLSTSAAFGANTPQTPSTTSQASHDEPAVPVDEDAEAGKRMPVIGPIPPARAVHCYHSMLLALRGRRTVLFEPVRHMAGVELVERPGDRPLVLPFENDQLLRAAEAGVGPFVDVRRPDVVSRGRDQLDRRAARLEPDRGSPPLEEPACEVDVVALDPERIPTVELVRGRVLLGGEDRLPRHRLLGVELHPRRELLERRDSPALDTAQPAGVHPPDVLQVSELEQMVQRDRPDERVVRGGVVAGDPVLGEPDDEDLLVPDLARGPRDHHPPDVDHRLDRRAVARAAALPEAREVPADHVVAPPMEVQVQPARRGSRTRSARAARESSVHPARASRRAHEPACPRTRGRSCALPPRSRQPHRA